MEAPLSRTSAVAETQARPMPLLSSLGGSPAARLTHMIQTILDSQSADDDTASRIHHVLSTAARQGLVKDEAPVTVRCTASFGCYVKKVSATLIIGGVSHPTEWHLDDERETRMLRYGPSISKPVRRTTH